MMRRSGIAIEGSPIILFIAFLAVIFAILDITTVTIIFVLLTALTIYFFRDPERYTPQEKNMAISPADGKVVAIEKVKNPYTNKECFCISIFMSLFNVHVNRTPLSASVKAIYYHKGKFFNASANKSSKYNERCDYLMQTYTDCFLIVQVAGFIARRIVKFIRIGDTLKSGERLGIIKFGSRVDFYMPSDYIPCINIGTKVIAGETIIAKCIKVKNNIN